MAKKQLWSLNGIANEVGKNFRTVSRALEDVRPDGGAKDGNPRWYLATAVAALGARARLTGRPSGSRAPERYDAKLEAQIAEIEHSGAEVDQLLARLRGEPSVARRREMIEAGGGKVVGAHERALVATIGDGATAPLRRVFCDSMMERITSELLQLCEWTLLPETGKAA
jgi:hypothetical protein